MTRKGDNEEDYVNPEDDPYGYGQQPPPIPPPPIQPEAPAGPPPPDVSRRVAAPPPDEGLYPTTEPIKPGGGESPVVKPPEPGDRTTPSPNVTATNPGTTAANYGAIPGFDLSKIQDLTHKNDKYSDALRVFSQGIGAGVPVVRGDLSAQVSWAKNHGFANAKQVGDDSIDFGDGRGPIDLIRGGDDALMFLDKAVWGTPGTSGGASTVKSGGGNSNADIASYLRDLEGLGAGPGSPGTFDSTSLQQVGQDPFSLELSGAIRSLLGTGGGGPNNLEALNLENARGAADRARKAELNQVKSIMAGRGTLDETSPEGGFGGLFNNAVGNVENNTIAPLFSQAVRDYTIHDADTRNANFLKAIELGNSRQGMLSDIAIRELEQSRLFNQFVAQFGLDKDKALAELAQGQNSQHIAHLPQYLQAAQGTQRGTV